MDIQFNFRHLQPSAELENYCKKRVNRLEKYHNRIDKLHIIFEVQKLDQVVSAVINIPPKHTVKAEGKSEDMYRSIDLLVDKLERILADHKNKLRDQDKG